MRSWQVIEESPLKRPRQEDWPFLVARFVPLQDERPAVCQEADAKDRGVQAQAWNPCAMSALCLAKDAAMVGSHGQQGILQVWGVKEISLASVEASPTATFMMLKDVINFVEQCQGKEVNGPQWLCQSIKYIQSCIYEWGCYKAAEISAALDKEPAP